MPHTPPLPITESALLVVDVQESFRADPDRWASRNNPGFEASLSRLLAAYRAAGLPVVFVLHSDDDPFFEEDGPFLRLQPFLDRRPGELLVHKRTRNAFTSTDLAARLAALGVRRLVVTGISTEQCVETTTRVAADLGYDVDFVTAATATFPIRHRDGDREELQTPEAITRATEFALRGRFARIASVGDIVREVAEAAPSRA